MSLYEPVWQGPQAVPPVVARTYPKSHSTHAVAPLVALNSPAGQFWQVGDPAKDENAPFGQGGHTSTLTLTRRFLNPARQTHPERPVPPAESESWGQAVHTLAAPEL